MNSMKLLLTLISAVLTISISGQTILSNKLLPAIGDSLYYAVDSNAVGVTITAPGVNQNWDFSQLKPIAASSEVYRRPSEGINFSSFQSADVLLQQGLTEYYYKLLTNRLDLMGTGLRSGFPIPGISGVNVYPKPVIEQKYPERYLDSLNYNTKTSIAFPSSILPDTIIKSLPLVPDSIRIVYNTKLKKECDAWGNVKLPAHSWNVLREKRVTINQVTLEAKVPFIGWLDVTNLISGSFPQLFGTFRSYSYAFLSNETKGFIALVNVDSLNNVLSVQYKPDDKIILKTNDASSNNEISIFPNPATHVISFSLKQINPDYFVVSLLDLQGKSYMTKTIFINDNSESQLNIDELPSGSYFLQISDRKKQKFRSMVFEKI